jgi:hypothetical protein
MEGKQMKDQDRDKPMFPNMQSTDQLKKDIWNEAIEAAASVDALGMNEYLAEEIRKMKKE